MTKKRTHIEVRRAQIMAQRKNKKLNLKAFKPDESSIRGRTAEFLNWSKENYPHQIITYEELTQAIFSLGKVPVKTSQHVKSVRGQMSSAGKRLMELYKTTLITEPGIGVRAAVDNADILKFSVPKAVDMHRRTAEKLRKTADQVHPDQLAKELKDLPGGQEKEDLLEMAAWFNEILGKYVRKLGQPQQQAALLPPPPPSE